MMCVFHKKKIKFSKGKHIQLYGHYIYTYMQIHYNILYEYLLQMK